VTNRSAMLLESQVRDFLDSILRNLQELSISQPKTSPSIGHSPSGKPLAVSLATQADFDILLATHAVHPGNQK